MSSLELRITLTSVLVVWAALVLLRMNTTPPWYIEMASLWMLVKHWFIRPLLIALSIIGVPVLLWHSAMYIVTGSWTRAGGIEQTTSEVATEGLTVPQGYRTQLEEA